MSVPTERSVGDVADIFIKCERNFGLNMDYHLIMQKQIVLKMLSGLVIWQSARKFMSRLTEVIGSKNYIN